MSKLMELVDKYGGACIAYGRNGGPDTHDEMAERQSELRTRMEALERDAARYRWLRGEVDGTALPLAQVVWKLNGNRESHNWTNMADGWSLDEHIDAAMEAEK